MLARGTMLRESGNSKENHEALRGALQDEF
jgi:hypothetical protein